VVYIAQNNYLDICVIWVVVIRVICSFFATTAFCKQSHSFKEKDSTHFMSSLDVWIPPFT